MKCKKCKSKLEKGQKICPNCETQVKKAKGGIVFAILGVLLVGLFVWMLFMSRWSVGQMGRMIANGDIKCFFVHNMTAPTCEHGNLCIDCGLEYGNKTDHSWQDATCTTSKTCVYCAMTEGEALGHSTLFGKCNTCGETVTELLDEYEKMQIKHDKALAYYGDAVDYFILASQSSGSSYDFYMSEVSKSVNSMGNQLDSAISLCGNHAEFSKVKKLMNSVNDHIPINSQEYYGLSDSQYFDYVFNELDEIGALMELVMKEYITVGEEAAE